MKGKMITIPADQSVEVGEESFATPPNLKALQTAVGGWIEAVPDWVTFMRRSGPVSCVVYCKEEGKLLELVENPRATALWNRALLRIRTEEFPRGYTTGDVLCGDVIVIIGDMEFMRQHIAGADPEDWGTKVEDWWLWGDFIPMKED